MHTSKPYVVFDVSAEDGDADFPSYVYLEMSDELLKRIESLSAQAREDQDDVTFEHSMYWLDKPIEAGAPNMPESSIYYETSLSTSSGSMASDLIDACDLLPVDNYPMGTTLVQAATDSGYQVLEQVIGVRPGMFAVGGSFDGIALNTPYISIEGVREWLDAHRLEQTPKGLRP